eukprot:gene34144-42101_t
MKLSESYGGAFYDRWDNNLDQPISNSTRFINHTAKGEADPVIRDFIRGRSKVNEKVIVFSEDSSLIVGINNLQHVKILNPGNCSVERSGDTYRLLGHLYSPMKFLSALSRLGDNLLQSLGGVNTRLPVNLQAKDLAWMAAFFDTDMVEKEESYQVQKAGGVETMVVTPFSLVLCLERYFYGYENLADKLEQKRRRLIAVSLFVRSVSHRLPGNKAPADEHCNPFVKAISLAMTNKKPLDGLPMHNPPQVWRAMECLRDPTSLLSTKLVRRHRRSCDMDRAASNMKLKFGKWISHEQQAVGQGSQQLLAPISSLVAQMKLLRRQALRGDIYRPAVVEDIAFSNHLKLNKWLAKHVGVGESREVRQFITLKSSSAQPAVGKLFQNQSALYVHLATEGVFPLSGTLCDSVTYRHGVRVSGGSGLRLTWKHSNAAEVVLAEDASCLGNKLYNERPSALLNLKYRASSFNTLFTTEADDSEPTRGADGVFLLLGLSPHCDEAAQVINRCWDALGLSGGRWTNSPAAAKNVVSVLSTFIILLRDSDVVKRRIAKLGDVKEFVSSVAMACVVSPLFVK